jgi:hypothetical protein
MSTESNYDALTFALAKEALEDKTDMVDCLEKYNLSDLYWNEVQTSLWMTRVKS